MLKNLGDIFTYTSQTLLEGEIEEISELIEYFEEFQNKVAERSKIEAPVYNFTLTSNEIIVPEDFLSFSDLKVDGKSVEIVSSWGRTLTLPIDKKSGSASLYYYKKPTPLDAENPDQVPDIDSRYFYTMGQYAFKMYYIVDDDDDMVKKVKELFFEGMTFYSNNKNIITKIKNVW